MVDIRKFKIYVRNTKVWKGYDYVVLPDGRVVGVPPGKYVRVTTVDNKPAFGFEDVTEEIGQKPDYDYDEPSCIVESESGFIVKKCVLKCRIGAGYTVDLYYDDKLIAQGLTGVRELPAIQLTYISIPELLGTVAGVGVLGAVVTYLIRKRVRR